MSAELSLEIRREWFGDHEQVFSVNAKAFETDAEARLVDALRPAAKPLVSLVATQGDQVVGHILFTPVDVEQNPSDKLLMALGPMAVLPQMQNRGIGSELVREGLTRCRALGADAIFVLGHEKYYPRFGFEPAPQHGLHYKSAEFDPYFMVLELQPGLLKSIEGQVQYHPEFERV